MKTSVIGKKGSDAKITIAAEPKIGISVLKGTTPNAGIFTPKAIKYRHDTTSNSYSFSILPSTIL